MLMCFIGALLDAAPSSLGVLGWYHMDWIGCLGLIGLGDLGLHGVMVVLVGYIGGLLVISCS